MGEDLQRISAGRYRVLGPLGKGGMGAVWRALDVELGRPVAVKELRLPEHISEQDRRNLYARMEREARAAARLKHPGIVTVYNRLVGGDGRPWIVMELIQGGSLEDLLQREGRLPVAQVSDIGVKILDALIAAHAAGVVHRDLKPANILLEGERVVVTDFGIAALEGDTKLTMSGAILGTPTFMSPEQVCGLPATPASDLWSLGATLYIAVEGRPPFSGRTLSSLFVAIATQDPAPQQHSGPLTAVLDGLLHKNPAERLTAEAARDRLRLLAATFEPHRSAPVSPVDALEPAVLVDTSGPASSSIAPVAGPSTNVAPPPTVVEKPITERPYPPPRHLVRSRKVIIPLTVVLALATSAAVWLMRGPSESEPPATQTWFPRAVRLPIENYGYGLALSPDGKTVALGGDDGIDFWDLASRQRSGPPIQPTGALRAGGTMAFSPDGRLLAATDDGRQDVDVRTFDQVRLWDVRSHQQIGKTFGRPLATVGSLSFSPDGQTLATSHQDETRLWNLTTQRQIGASFPNNAAGPVTFLDQAGKLLATDHDLTVWNIKTRRKSGRPFMPLSVNLCDLVVVSPNGKILAAATNDHEIKLFSVNSRKKISNPIKITASPSYEDVIASLSFSPDGRLLISAGSTVRIWDVKTGRQVGPTLTGKPVIAGLGPWRSAVVSPDGRSLITVGDHALEVWDIRRAYQ
ncbi:protein kinase [Nonomuraea sp. B12E4]|uniref:WD40 repeat domain-containing serine/threonine protein kinase n=1 Tax=Nonomuraea sp. B12E4 TaxID=3153564 RepID=UPI00325F63C3